MSVVYLTAVVPAALVVRRGKERGERGAPGELRELVKDGSGSRT